MAGEFAALLAELDTKLANVFISEDSHSMQMSKDDFLADLKFDFDLKSSKVKLPRWMDGEVNGAIKHYRKKFGEFYDMKRILGKDVK